MSSTDSNSTDSNSTGSNSTGSNSTDSNRIVTAARGWIGTPFRHQASVKGAGCDCLGLIRGLWRELVGPEPEIVPPYTPDWSEPQAQEWLWQAMARHFQPAPVMPCSGEVLLFRLRAGSVAKHLGILTHGPAGSGVIAGPGVIHAYSGHGVVESTLGPAWQRRIAARFVFPERVQ